MEKKDDGKNIMMILLAAIALISLGALAFSYLNNEMLTQFIAQVQNYKPVVDQAISDGVIITTGGGN